jgi:hypothetical protein
MRVKAVAVKQVIICALLFFSFCPNLRAEDNVKITVLAANPDDTSMKAPIIYYLPAEIKPDDVLDAQGMDVKYDADKKSYFLTKEIDLGPKETKSLNVTVKNVWMVRTEEFAAARDSIAQKMQGLAGTKYEQTSGLLVQKVNDRLDSIENAQKKSRERGDSLRKQIELYRANVKQLEQINQEISTIEAIRRAEEESKGETATIKFQITAENPSDETMTMNVQSTLPQEITADDILNKLDFDLIYDDMAQQFSLTKQESFAPKEVKKFTITIRNIWHIPQNELDFMKEQTDRLMENIEGSAFEGYARQNAESIYELLKQIQEQQTLVQDSKLIEDHQRAYAINSQRLVLIKKKIQELQDLLLDVSEKKDTSVVDQVQNMILQKLLKLRDMLLQKLGYKPDRTTTWMIIFGICVFLALLAVGFYMVWLKQIQKEAAKERLARPAVK